MKRVLAFDTATEVVAIALGLWPEEGEDAPAEVIAELDFAARRDALSRLLPGVKALLATQGLEPDGIGAVVVGRGPGSFTGVRIGVASAKGLAQGLGVPLFGVGTPDAIAWRFAAHEGLVGIVGDAMRREVYATLFTCGGGSARRLSDHDVCSPAEAAERWARDTREPLVLAGNGLAKYADVFADALGERAVFAPRAQWHAGGAGLLEAARAVLGELGDGDPGVVLPVYTRLSDAEENEAGRAGSPPASGVAGAGPDWSGGS